MKPIIIIQARTGSSRLPNKTILPFYGGKSILEILVNRLQTAVPDTKVVVATSTNPGDDQIEQLCNKCGFNVYRGDENDVLARFIGSAEEYGADKLIRICADNIFLDVKMLKSLVDHFNADDSDYTSYSSADGTPMILTHYGLWALEACKLSALQRVANETDEKQAHEHVTWYLYNHPSEFKVSFIPVESDIQKERRLRLTIDTEEDFKMMQTIYSRLIENDLEINPENIVATINEFPGFYDRMEMIINQNKKIPAMKS